jgi:uncharacterized OB-fold protein
LAPPTPGIVTAPKSDDRTDFLDPRPAVRELVDGSWRFAGARCTVCAYPLIEVLDRCPLCRGPCVPDEFGPDATVFAATVLHVSVPGRAAPYALAYVDVDEGPRILTHVDSVDVALAPGARVTLVGRNADGDPLVRQIAEGATQ